ncbi:hypothetical protein O6H91_04G015500 [Diphasiastrum complanatum]|uniref:Uncharacterized protein n=1 Tax=Diphasiastrum complanatum TaxID=34168 RepID=A0ACC2DV97_DIPCM|nr:hypothetical protein O6H91_04G015500 [Diphasiastrum complanatum]
MQTTGKHKAEKARKKKAGFLTEAISTGVEEQSNTPINICGEQTNLQDEQTAGKHKAEKVHKKGGGSFTDTIAMGVEEQSSGPINICGEQNDLQDEQTTGKLKAEKARKKKGGYLTEAISTGVEEQSIGPRNICGDENKHTDIENEVKKVRKRKLPHRSVQHKRRVEKTVDITASDPTHLTMKQIICWAESKERKKLKENASQSKEHVIPASTSQQRVDHLGRAEKKAEMAPQVQIIDGQIVINEQSLTISASAANKDNLETYRRVDENSSKLNYHSYMNKTPTERWSLEETELFYKAVRQFGTDFALIQNLFPGRTRRQIKAKFKKEDRLNPFRINSTLQHRSKGYLHYEEVIDILKASSQKTDESDLFDYQLDAYIADPSSRQNGSMTTEDTVLLHPKSSDNAGPLRGLEENVGTAKPQDASKIVHTAGKAKHNEEPSTVKGRSKQDSMHLTNDSVLNTDLIKESPISDPLSNYQDTEFNNPLGSYD